MAQIGGSIKKLEIGGYSFFPTIDNEPTFNPGGDVIVETGTTNNGPIFMVNKVPGVIKGLEVRIFTKHGSLEVFEELKTASIENPVSFLIELADGSKWTASGGVRIVPDGVEDGHINLRTGACTVSLFAENGTFVSI